MSRIGTVVKMLYGDQVKPAYNNSGADMDVKSSRRKKKFTALKKTLGSRRTLIWVIRIVVVLVVLFIAAESVFQFNRFATWQTKVMSRQADIEREYQRRENLIPNLVFAVSKYATYEKGVFKDIADARSELMKIQKSEISQSQINSVLEKALSRLVAWAEQYPDLKATLSVQDLIKEVSNTEDRIADAKKTYNEACEIYNQYGSVFPGNVFAFIYRYKPLPYMGLEDVNVPVVDLDMTKSETVVEEAAEVPANNPNKTEGVKE
jgi:LemA protein